MLLKINFNYNSFTYNYISLKKQQKNILCRNFSIQIRCSNLNINYRRMYKKKKNVATYITLSAIQYYILRKSLEKLCIKVYKSLIKEKEISHYMNSLEMILKLGNLMKNFNELYFMIYDTHRLCLFCAI